LDAAKNHERQIEYFKSIDAHKKETK
jgi:hypothetical protein